MPTTVQLQQQITEQKKLIDKLLKKQAGETSDSEDQSSSDEADPATLMKPKLEAPRSKFSGDKSQFKTWSRVVSIWYNSRKAYATQETLGGFVLEALDERVQTMVLARLDDGKETYKNVMKALRSEFGDDQLLMTTDAVTQFRSLARGKESLSDFLVQYETYRLAAVKEGYEGSKKTDGVDLLNACDLPPQVHSQILINLSGKDPSYKIVLKLIKTVANSEALKQRERAGRREKREKAALTGLAHAGGKGGRSGVAKQIHKKGDKKGKGKGKGTQEKGSKKHILCKFFQEGKCTRGASCTFSHGSKPVLTGAQEWKPGDWECGKAECKAHNFAKNVQCFKCGEAKPGGGKKGDGKGKGKGTTPSGKVA